MFAKEKNSNSKQEGGGSAESDKSPVVVIPLEQQQLAEASISNKGTTSKRSREKKNKTEAVQENEVEDERQQHRVLSEGEEASSSSSSDEDSDSSSDSSGCDDTESVCSSVSDTENKKRKKRALEKEGKDDEEGELQIHASPRTSQRSHVMDFLFTEAVEDNSVHQPQKKKAKKGKGLREESTAGERKQLTERSSDNGSGTVGGGLRHDGEKRKTSAGTTALISRGEKSGVAECEVAYVSGGGLQRERSKLSVAGKVSPGKNGELQPSGGVISKLELWKIPKKSPPKAEQELQQKLKYESLFISPESAQQFLIKYTNGLEIREENMKEIIKLQQELSLKQKEIKFLQEVYAKKCDELAACKKKSKEVYDPASPGMDFSETKNLEGTVAQLKQKLQQQQRQAQQDLEDCRVRWQKRLEEHQQNFPSPQRLAELEQNEIQLKLIKDVLFANFYKCHRCGILLRNVADFHGHLYEVHNLRIAQTAGPYKRH